MPLNNCNITENEIMQAKRGDARRLYPKGYFRKFEVVNDLTGPREICITPKL